MKNRLIAIASFCIACFCATTACNTSEFGEKEIQIVSATVSDCQQGKSAAMPYAYVEKVKIKAIGDKHYIISHENTIFNCCLPKGIETSVNYGNDTLFVTEKERVPGICDCICPYGISLEIADVADGDYVLCILKQEIHHFAFAVRLDASTDIEAIVSGEANNP
jgi:hypothetical protein